MGVYSWIEGTEAVTEVIMEKIGLGPLSNSYGIHKAVWSCVVMFVSSCPYQSVLLSAGQRAADSPVHHRPSQCAGGAVWQSHLPEQLWPARRLQHGRLPASTGGQGSVRGGDGGVMFSRYQMGEHICWKSIESTCFYSLFWHILYCFMPTYWT